MTVEEVKVLLRITGTTYDNYLAAVLPLAIQYVKDECNNQFLDENGKENLPGGVQLAIAKLCEIYMKESGVQSETLARHSQTFSLDIPKYIKDMLKPYRRVIFV